MHTRTVDYDAPSSTQVQAHPSQCPPFNPAPGTPESIEQRHEDGAPWVAWWRGETLPMTESPGIRPSGPSLSSGAWSDDDEVDTVRPSERHALLEEMALRGAPSSSGLPPLPAFAQTPPIGLKEGDVLPKGMRHHTLGLLECLLCGHQLNDPVTLPCGWSTCRQCLHVAAQSSPYPCLLSRPCPFANPGLLPPSEIPCPMGAHSAVEGPTDIVLANLVTLSRSVPSHVWETTFDMVTVDTEMEGEREAKGQGQDKDEDEDEDEDNDDYLPSIESTGGMSPFLMSCGLRTPEASISTHLEAMALRSRLRKELECGVCYSHLSAPSTLACGHTYCGDCLFRALDHAPRCPSCRSTVLSGPMRPPLSRSRLLDHFLRALSPHHVADERGGIDQEEAWMPVLVCSLLLPSQSIQLHIFEPRYRLLIRRCLAMPKDRQVFGMCLGSVGPSGTYAAYGTYAHILSVHYLPDGRSVVHVRGGASFRVLSRSQADGYNIATLAPLSVGEGIRAGLVHGLPREVDIARGKIEIAHLRSLLLRYFTSHPMNPAFGPMPEADENIVWWAASLLPMSEPQKYPLLSLERPSDRLALVSHWAHILEDIWSRGA